MAARSGGRSGSVAIVRPDRFVFALVPAREVGAVTREFARQLHRTAASAVHDSAAATRALDEGGRMNTVLAYDRGQQPVDSPVQAAALALRSARAARRPIAPISSSFGIAGLDAAYAVAELNTQARIAEGRRVVGKKVGLTSRAVQQQLGVTSRTSACCSTTWSSSTARTCRCSG